MAEIVLTKVEEEVAKFLASDDSYVSYGFGSGALTVGFSGQIEALKPVVMTGGNLTKRVSNQRLALKSGLIELPNKGGDSVTIALVFEGGARTIALGTLTQCPESTIDVDGTIHQFNKMPGKVWAELVAKKATIECTKAQPHPKMVRRIPQLQPDGKSEMIERSLNVYEFIVTAYDGVAV